MTPVPPDIFCCCGPPVATYRLIPYGSRDLTMVFDLTGGEITTGCYPLSVSPGNWHWYLLHSRPTLAGHYALKYSDSNYDRGYWYFDTDMYADWFLNAEGTIYENCLPCECLYEANAWIFDPYTIEVEIGQTDNLLWSVEVRFTFTRDSGTRSYAVSYRWDGPMDFSELGAGTIQITLDQVYDENPIVESGSISATLWMPCPIDYPVPVGQEGVIYTHTNLQAYLDAGQNYVKLADQHWYYIWQDNTGDYLSDGEVEIVEASSYANLKCCIFC